MLFSEPRAGKGFKEVFTRLGYCKPTNGLEKAIHHLIGTKTSSLAYLLVQGSCFAVPFSLSSLLSHLQCCLLKFSCVGLSLQFTVHKTVGSAQVSYEYLSHVSHWRSGSTSPRKSTYDARPSSRSWHRGCGLDTRLAKNLNHLYPLRLRPISDQ